MKKMNQEQKESCQKIIHSAATAAGGIGLSPIPGSDIAPLIAIQTTMIIALGRVFNVKIDKSYAASLAKTAIVGQIGKLVASQLLKLIPGLGSVANAGVAFSLTEVLGWDVAEEFCEMVTEKLCA